MSGLHLCLSRYTCRVAFYVGFSLLVELDSWSCTCPTWNVDGAFEYSWLGLWRTDASSHLVYEIASHRPSSHVTFITQCFEAHDSCKHEKLTTTNGMSKTRNPIAWKVMTRTGKNPLLLVISWRISNRQPPRPWLSLLIDQDSLPIALFDFLRCIVCDLDRPESGSSVLGSWVKLIADQQRAPIL